MPLRAFGLKAKRQGHFGNFLTKMPQISPIRSCEKGEGFIRFRALFSLPQPKKKEGGGACVAIVPSLPTPPPELPRATVGQKQAPDHRYRPVR